MQTRNMIGIYGRHFVSLIRNVSTKYQRQSLTISPVKSYLLCIKHLHSNSQSVVPVKLAYTSYESLKDSNETSKQPIMIMHGLFGSKNNWNTLSQTIHQKTSRKVIAVDARNHGDSPHSSEMSYKHMARDIVQLLHDLGFEKCVLVGHSMGGSAMMYTALNYPEIVEKLIVVDMSPVRTSPSLKEMGSIFQAMRSVVFDANLPLSKVRTAANEQLAKTVKHPALRQFLMMNLVEADSGKYKWRVNLPVLEQNFATQIAVFPNIQSKIYEGPTLFIGGGNSDFIRVNDHTAIKKLFPSARFHYIPGANHWVHADKPVEFVKLISTFINETHS